MGGKKKSSPKKCSKPKSPQKLYPDLPGLSEPVTRARCPELSDSDSLTGDLSESSQEDFYSQISHDIMDEDVEIVEAEKSLVGALETFKNFDCTSKIAFLLVILTAILLSPVVIPIFDKAENLSDFSKIAEFSNRKKLFKEIYYKKFEIGPEVNRVIWSAIQKQRDDPPNEPLIFLLFSPHVTKVQLDFARDLGAVPRQQGVNFLTHKEVKSRHGFLDLLSENFSRGKSVVVDRLDLIEPSDALALYGIAESHGMKIAKNKTVVLLFESQKIEKNWKEKRLIGLLQNWIEDGNVSLGENRGLISRIGNHIFKLPGES